MLRNAISAFTRVFDALWLAPWCAADPGYIWFNDEWVRRCGATQRTRRCCASPGALHRVRDT